MASNSLQQKPEAAEEDTSNRSLNDTSYGELLANSESSDDNNGYSVDK